MKYLLPLILLCLISCGHKKTDLERRAEEVRKEKADKQKRIENNKQRHKTDSLAAIAWGDAIFSMTKDETLKTKAFCGGDVYDNIIEMNYERLFAFREAFDLPLLYSIKAYFVKGQLENIFIDSRKVGARDFTKLERECIILKNQFYRIYGQPKSTNDVSFSGFNSDGNQHVASFSVEGRLFKDITIELQKDEYDYSYHISISGRTTRELLEEWILKSQDDKNPDDVVIYSF